MTTPHEPFPDKAGWPADWDGCRITGRFLDMLGNAMSGTVTFTPEVTAVLDSTNDVIVLPATRSVTLDAFGAFDIILPATNNPNANPTNFTYKVVEGMPGGRTYSITAPMGETRNLADIAPVPGSTGNAITRGAPGPGISHQAAPGAAFVNTGGRIYVGYDFPTNFPDGSIFFKEVTA